MRNILRKGVLWAGVVLTSPAALAVESGGGNTPNGADGFMAGALPPPGTYGLAFLNNYKGDRFNDSNGNSSVPGFSVKANVAALKIVHMTNTPVYGGLLGFYGALPLVDQTVKAAGRSDSRTGLGDLELGSLVAWHKNDWHWYGLLAVVAPTGLYNKDRLANIGSNYTTIRPQFGWTYAPANGLDISSRMTYSFNTRNNATNYKSGQYFEADYNVGYAFVPNFKVGLQGYYFQQITNDEQNGLKVGSNGNKGRVLAIGPGLFYQASFASFELKYLTETMVENRVQGKSLWFKSVFSF